MDALEDVLVEAEVAEVAAAAQAPAAEAAPKAEAPIRSPRRRLSVDDVHRRAKAAPPSATALLNSVVPQAERDDARQKRLASLGFVLHDVADFIKAKFPPPKWIIRDFIAVGMKGDICGGSKSFKTYLGLQLAICAAAGVDFLGVYKIRERHKVTFVDLELLPWTLQERINSVCSGLGVDPESLRGWLNTVPLRGFDAATVLRDSYEDVVAELKSHGTELTIIDPRYKILKAGEDENSAAGLRGILDFRDAVARVSAVVLTTHDCKGDTSGKKLTDRGSGSYTQGADFDFRLTIDKAAGWTSDSLSYVLDAGCRARRAPAAIGIRFDQERWFFTADADVVPLKLDERLATRGNAETRATREATVQAAYRKAALAVVEEAGDNLLDVTRFDDQVAKVPGASLGENRRRAARKALVSVGVLEEVHQLERKSGGEVRERKNGFTFVTTPERAEAYRTRFEGWSKEVERR